MTNNKTNWKQKTNRRENLPSNWKAIRKDILNRDSYACVMCGAPATDVDHIGNRLDHSPENLRALCSACHKHRTAMQGQRAMRAKRAALKHRPREQHPSER